MNHKKILILLVIVAIVIASFTGVIPGLNILGTEGYETQSKWYECYQGNPDKELILPEARKGFITSYRNDLDFGLSETIVAEGNYKVQVGWPRIKNYKYVVKYKSSPWAGWETVSEPGHTENWISVENPGKLVPTVSTPGDRTCEGYVFNIRGQREGAIRIELWAYFDPNFMYPLDTWVWKLLSSDQALLVSGKCGMWLPPRDDGGYQSTFEIGETVKIKVETGVGAPDVDVDGREGEKTWELHLKNPDGTEYTEQNFPRKLQDHFKGDVTFKIYEDMFTLGGNNRYELELYNTLWKKGTLELSSIDIRAKRPDKPTIEPDCGMSLQVPDTVSVTLKATPNEETQLPITVFGVQVWYGKSTDLAPGSWGDDRWILRDTMVTATDNTVSFSFEVTSPNRWFSIIAYSHDEEGRDSDTEVYQVQTYEDGSDEPSEEDLIEEGGGQSSYGGGSSGETTPWNFWENPDDNTWILRMIAAIIVFLVSCLVAFLTPFPKKYGLYGIIGCIVIGAVLAILFAAGAVF